MRAVVAMAVVVMACGKHESPAPAPAPAPAKSPEAVARAFVTKLASHDNAGAIALAGAPMRGAADQLGAAWHKIEVDHGALVSLGAASVGPRTVTIVGKFPHDALDLEVAIIAGEVVGFHYKSPWREPPYANPAAYTATPTTVGSAPALPGTLTMPVGAGPFPAVVLVHGSGPNDADESIGTIKVFADLADGLASRGVAVLRYDKRTKISPRGVITTKQEYDDSVHAAVAQLATTPRIDPARIVVLGHSQGGSVAPRIATDDPKVRGLILLAASTRSLPDAMIAQTRYMQTLMPQNAQLAGQLAAAETLKTAVEDPALTADTRMPAIAGGVTGAYFLADRDYHPAEVAAKLTIPIAVLQGLRDYQVTPADDFAAWQAALHGHPNVKLYTYPALGHAFVAGSGAPSPADYSQPDAHVDPKVIDDLATWMQALPH